ncbi:hypothetical protein [Planctomicrobium sp. SH527]|uniref:hypothetical protein n=1 Tax=Planctomicrobium sp. SH527 TaxID=3448123 RepID=UPI003F5B9707
MTTILNLTRSFLLVSVLLAPGCGKSGTQTESKDNAAPVIDPENSKDGIERTKHFST